MIKRIITSVALALACFAANVADSSAVSVPSGAGMARLTKARIVQSVQAKLASSEKRLSGKKLAPSNKRLSNKKLSSGKKLSQSFASKELVPAGSQRSQASCRKSVAVRGAGRMPVSLKHNCAGCMRKGSAVVHVSKNPQKSAQKKVVRKPAILSSAQRKAVKKAFAEGKAGGLPSSKLLSAQVFTREALKGGIFRRPGAVKFVVLHSTETATEADAKRVIRSWNNSGANHCGTQYVVDRDGVIYETVDPAWGTYHIDTSKARFGVKNGNSVGIEIVRSGEQRYTTAQLKSLSRLVSYLQNRFQIAEDGIVSHGYVQPADRSDPVAFDWIGFSRLMKQTNPKPVLVNILNQSSKV